MATAEEVKEAIWLRGFVIHLSHIEKIRTCPHRVSSL
jgi:hypothetical protein